MRVFKTKCVSGIGAILAGIVGISMLEESKL